jgi:hypothetical protein
VIDPQRDVIHDRKLTKPLGQAAQFNGRQISLPGLRRCRPVIYRWINISTKKPAAKRLGGRLGAYTFA